MYKYRLIIKVKTVWNGFIKDVRSRFSILSKPLAFINMLYDLSKSLWLILLFLGLFAFAFIFVEQGLDILSSVQYDHGGFVQFAFLQVALFWFAFQIFRTSQLLLTYYLFNPNKYHRIEFESKVFFKKLAKRVSYLPYFITLIALLEASNYTYTKVFSFTLLHFFLYWYTIKALDKKDISIGRPRNLKVAEILKTKLGKETLIRIISGIAIFIFFLLGTASISKLIGASAIVLFALSTWLIIASALYLLRVSSNIPFIAALVIWPFLVSIFNNNHQIRLLDKPNSFTLPSIKNDFTGWLSNLDSENCLKYQDSTLVYLVAAEGGGIRAAYYSAAVLNALNKLNPNFGKQCYAISSVSGGSLGSAIFTRQLAEQNNAKGKEWKSMLSKDFISHLTSKLVFNDVLQRFIPFPILTFDRARGIEKDWERSIKRVWKLKNGEEKKGFLDFHSKHKELPRLLMNCTQVETGNRLLLSPVQINSFFRSSNLFQVKNKDIPLSTAVSLSSRFPYLTPAGLLKLDTNKISIVDGGYFDNSGTQTLYELYDQLKKNLPKGKKVKFAFIVLKNSKKPDKQYKGILHESLSPPRTFLNVWDARGYFSMQQLKIKSQEDNSLYFPIYLNRFKEERIPLGWFISREAIAFMDKDILAKESQLKGVLGISDGHLSYQKFYLK